MRFRKFLDNQESLYYEISHEIKDVEKLGLNPRSSLVSGERGVMIALNYENAVLDKISQISITINKIIPSVIYKKNNLHTTVVSSPVNEISEGMPDYKNIFIKILDKVFSVKKYNIKVNFNRWLLSRESLILAGLPNRDFFYLANAIIEEAKLFHLELKYPKMTHITLSRFTKAMASDEIKDLIHYYKSLKPLGLAYAVNLYVGSFDNSIAAVNIHVHKSYSINNENSDSI
jgi:hypothetical protein